MSDEFLYANFARSALTVDISASGTTLTIPSGDSGDFPSPGAGQLFAGVLYDGVQAPEVIHCSANGADGTFTVARGQEGTIAVAWRAGTKFFAAPTAAALRGDIPGPSVIVGDLNVTGSLDVDVDANVDGDLTIVGDITGNNDVLGDLGVGGDLAVTGDASADNITAAGDITPSGFFINAHGATVPNITDLAHAAPLSPEEIQDTITRFEYWKSDEWTVTIIGTGAVSLDAGQNVSRLKVSTSAGAGDNSQAQKTSHGRVIPAGAPGLSFWCFVAWNPGGSVEGETLLGLAGTDTTLCGAGPPTVDEFVGFVTDNDGEIDFITRTGGVENRTNIIASVPATNARMALGFEGTRTSVTPYVNGVAGTPTIGLIPTTAVLRESYAIRATTAVIRRLQVYASRITRVI